VASLLELVRLRSECRSLPDLSTSTDPKGASPASSAWRASVIDWRIYLRSVSVEAILN